MKNILGVLTVFGKFPIGFGLFLVTCDHMKTPFERNIQLKAQFKLFLSLVGQCYVLYQQPYNVLHKYINP
ncbi:Uncharacterized protein APZ42_020480 [Daphnia magna]|uniref:Uncharacterized protein n=1 Tax=Daphnia magna TaxID=35525 RepID=A0A164XHU0_9CRUS|nr:Uncharacterized protein APZ42_020480 [Daphnia magna]